METVILYPSQTLMHETATRLRPLRPIPSVPPDVDFDVLVGGHFSRLGTKEDVQTKVDFFADVLSGAELALAAVSASDLAIGTGVADGPNAGNTMCVFSL